MMPVHDRRGRRATAPGAVPFVLLPTLALASCASGPAFDNPPGCVAAASPVPADSLDAAAVPRQMTISPALAIREAEIHMVVGADGRVDPATVTAPGVTDRRVLGQLRSDVSRWTFTPARRGTCWVPSDFRYTLRMDRP